MTWFVCLLCFLNPESVYPLDDSTYFVSEIGKFGIRGDGKIYKVTGNKKEVIADSLDDPKGITVVGKKLFVTDINKIWEINTFTKEKQVFLREEEFPTPPEFLNDLAYYKDKLYATDSDLGIVFVISLKTKKTKVFSRVEKVNGIFVKNEDSIFVITYDYPAKLIQIDKGGRKKTTFTFDIVEGGDGLWITKDGTIFVSGFISGNIIAYKHGKKIKVLAENLRTPADFGFHEESQFLFVPLMMKGDIIKLQYIED